MLESIIDSFVQLKGRLEAIRRSDQFVADDIVDEVITNMVIKYENDYINQVPEEDSEFVDIYAYYKRIKCSNGHEKFSMLINGDEYADHPDMTCARNFDILESVANAEGIGVRHMTSEELLKIGGADAIGGYKFSINRKNLGKVIEHSQALKKYKTIPKTLLRIR